MRTTKERAMTYCFERNSSSEACLGLRLQFNFVKKEEIRETYISHLCCGPLQSEYHHRRWDLNTYCSHGPSTEFQDTLSSLTLIGLKDGIRLSVRHRSGEDEVNTTSATPSVQYSLHARSRTHLAYGKMNVT